VNKKEAPTKTARRRKQRAAVRSAHRTPPHRRAPRDLEVRREHADDALVALGAVEGLTLDGRRKHGGAAAFQRTFTIFAIKALAWSILAQPRHPRDSTSALKQLGRSSRAAPSV
jgi:hypothetical protein